MGHTQLSSGDAAHSGSSLLEPEEWGQQFPIRRPHHGCSLEEAASLLYPSSYDWSTTAVYFLTLDPMKSEREDAVHTDSRRRAQRTRDPRNWGRSWKEASGETAGVTDVGPAGDSQHFTTSFFTSGR